MAGVELVNNARATAYADALGVDGVGCDSCMCLHFGAGDPPYTNPVADTAPWLDPDVPASQRFGGMLSLGIDGLSSSTGGRSVTPLLGDGGLLGRLVRAPREFTVTALAVACDEEALSYGLGWLASVLRGSACAPGCGGDSLCVMAWCPGEYATSQQWDAAMRHLYGVGLLSGPTVVERINMTPGSCDPTPLARVEFTLAAGIPWLFRSPVLATAPAWAPTTAGQVSDPPPPCPATSGCPGDPDCPPPVLPAVPVVPDPCGCVLSATPRRTMVRVAPAGAAWLESVPVIEVRTGSQPLDCLRVRFWTAPGGTTCAQAVTEPCNFCGEIGVGWLPANATLFIDGRRQVASVQCDQPGYSVGPDPTPPPLSGGPGEAFTWPVFDCPGAVCFELLANTAADDSQVTVGLAVREDAA